MTMTVGELRSLLNHLPAEMKIAVESPAGQAIYLDGRIRIPPYPTATGAHFTTAYFHTVEEDETQRHADFRRVYDSITHAVELAEEIGAEDHEYYPIIDQLDATARFLLDDYEKGNN